MSSEADKFTQKYINLLSNDLFLSANDVFKIIEADSLTEEEMLLIQSVTTGENNIDA